MTTPAEVLAQLSPDARAELTERTNREGLIRLAIHVSLIGFGMLYVGYGWPMWWLMMAPLGVLLAFLFTLQHECTHQTPFKNKTLNEIIGHLCALILCQPFLWFRAFHLAHHKHTNDPAHDPELQGDAKPESWREMLWHLSTIGYWAGKVRVLWANANGKTENAYVSPRAAKRIKSEARLLIAGYAAIAAFCIMVSPNLLWIWLFPIALGFPVLRLYLLAEHGRCPQVANMFENTRTTLSTQMVNLIAWNMPYHAEHHAYPAIPFHKLPKAHLATRDHLSVLTAGYTTFACDYVKPFKD